MKNKRKRAACLLLAVLCVVQLLTMFCVSATAAGETASVSNVLDDLKRDPDFKVEDYPENAEDYSVQVIQVAEGVNGELFVYVYRPEGTDNAAHRAKYINMSVVNPQENTNDLLEIDNPQNKLYSLTWLNGNGTLEKYQVNDFTVSSDIYRYYNIVAVYRPFDENTDTKEDKSWDDVTGFKGFQVGYCWRFYYYNGALVNETKKVEVVDIDIKVVGFVQYDEGYLFWDEQCHAHYVGFSVENYDVNHIYDADVTFKHQSYKRVLDQNSFGGVEETITRGEEIGPVTKTITEDMLGSNDGGGWLGHKYEWKRIVTKQEFVDQILAAKNEENFEDVTDNQVTDDKGQENPWADVQYVFQFWETSYYQNYGEYSTLEKTLVYDVGILRLHFATPEGTYNLGVVGDLVSDDGKADIIVDVLDNIENNLEDMWEILEKILGVVLLVLLLVVFWPIIGPPVKFIFNLIWGGIKQIFKFIWTVLTWPFRLIARLLFPKK